MQLLVFKIYTYQWNLKKLNFLFLRDFKNLLIRSSTEGLSEGNFTIYVSNFILFCSYSLHINKEKENKYFSKHDVNKEKKNDSSSEVEREITR